MVCVILVIDYCSEISYDVYSTGFFISIYVIILIVCDRESALCLLEDNISDLCIKSSTELALIYKGCAESIFKIMSFFIDFLCQVVSKPFFHDSFRSKKCNQPLSSAFFHVNLTFILTSLKALKAL